jgi:hypothetical protein
LRGQDRATNVGPRRSELIDGCGRGRELDGEKDTALVARDGIADNLPDDRRHKYKRGDSPCEQPTRSSVHAPTSERGIRRRISQKLWSRADTQETSRLMSSNKNQRQNAVTLRRACHRQDGSSA